MPAPRLGHLLLVGLLAAPLVGLGATARAQLLGDEAPYFLWADAWSGKLSGKEVFQQTVSQSGMSFQQTATLTARSGKVVYDTMNGRGFFETWQGKDNTADLKLTFNATGGGGDVTAHVGMAPISGTVHLDNFPANNGVTVDATKKTIAIAMDTCSVARCDKLAPGHHLTVTAPNVRRSADGSQPNDVRFKAVAQRPWPKTRLDVSGTYDSGPQGSGGTSQETTLTYDVLPEFHIDAWAAEYRASYVKARQSDLAPFKQYTPERCGPETLASSPCRAAYRERRFLKANADAATADFKRVVQAIIDRTCPDFTRHLNLFEERQKDIVIEGPIATYDLVQDVLKASITSDPHVSYNRLPDFMRCMYAYDAFKSAVTIHMPGTNPFAP